MKLVSSVTYHIEVCLDIALFSLFLCEYSSPAHTCDTCATVSIELTMFVITVWIFV
jgi:hypothetical protein